MSEDDTHSTKVQFWQIIHNNYSPGEISLWKNYMDNVVAQWGSGAKQRPYDWEVD